MTILEGNLGSYAMHTVKNRKWLAIAALAVGAVCLAPNMHADADGGRAVRLSYVDGQVRITQGDQVIAEQATINTPLMEGMQITTVDDGKAEIQFEDGSVARLSPDTTLTLTTLSGEGEGGVAEITLNGGLAYFELQDGNQSGQMSVHFGDNTATASGFTVLRVQMDTPPGGVGVFSGNAHLEGAGGSLSMDLHGGESLSLMPGDEGRSVVSETIDPDSWDAWNSDRDQALTAEDSADTGAGLNIGGDQSQNPAWHDLDANGNWYNVPGQGYVWSPYDASNSSFDPYGNGSWTFTPGYGYTWASAYSWGYLPYQCGAWNFYDGFGWGWAPGFGGCQPWWGLGFYPGPRFGSGFLPGWYHPPHRPMGPRHPFPGHPVPVIAVNHKPSAAPVGSLPERNRGGPVSIAGNNVHPLPARPGFARPGFARPGFDRSGFDRPGTGSSNPGLSNPGLSSRGPVYANGAGNGLRNGSPNQPGNGPHTFNPGARPGYVPAPRGSFEAPRPGSQNQYHPAPAQQPRYAAPPPRNNSAPPPHFSAPPPRPSAPPPPPPSRPSGGGGGGGGSHAGGGGHK